MIFRADDKSLAQTLLILRNGKVEQKHRAKATMHEIAIHSMTLHSDFASLSLRSLIFI